MAFDVDHHVAIFRRGADELLVESELRHKLARGKPLNIKEGFDPTRPDLHLGHTVQFNKLRQLQDLGHHVVFLVGDFTTLIGDPTGRNVTRPALAAEEVAVNAKTYTDQAFLILDRAKTEVAFNSRWLAALPRYISFVYLNSGPRSTKATVFSDLDATTAMPPFTYRS